MIKRLIALVSVSALAGCSVQDQGISKALTRQVQDSAVEIVDISSLGPKGWERVCVLGPYTLPEASKELLGFEWEPGGRASLQTSDSTSVLVLLKGNEVLAFAEHPRDHGDFLRLTPRCLPRNKARFSKVVEQGRVQLIADEA